MSGISTPKRGEVYCLGPKYKFLVISPVEVNSLGVSVCVPIAPSGDFSGIKGLVVSLSVEGVSAVVLCNQARSFDIKARVLAGTARYVETVSLETVSEVIDRVLSVIDPAPEP